MPRTFLSALLLLIVGAVLSRDATWPPLVNEASAENVIQAYLDRPSCDCAAPTTECEQVMTSSLLVVHVIRSDNDITYPLIVFRDALDGFFTVRFTTDNCTEPAYIAVNPGSPPSIWTLADLGPPGAIGPTVYVAQPDAALENISLRSFWNVTILADSTVIEGCDLDERDFFAKPAEFLTELNLTPPFRVVLPE